VDHTGSEEGKQPAKENGTPSQFSAGDERGQKHPEQEGNSESARRAFDLLERFSGELEEILLSLERAKSNATSTESSPRAPEQTFSPSSIHFDPSPISARIDPNALPPVESPGAASRSTLRLTSEAGFLILVAAISARTGLRPLLIVVAEAAAFLIVASVELAIAHDRRRYRQLPASAPAFASLPAQETGTTSERLSVTLDQVEPLVWRADRHDDAAEANWPLAAFVSPSEPDEAESIEEAQEGATEISTAAHPEGGVAAVPGPTPKVESEAASERAEVIPAAEPEPEAQPESADAIPASEPELEHRRRFGLFRHEASEPAGEAEIEPEVEAETPDSTTTETETEAEAEFESAPEIPAPEPEPEHHRRFGLFRHEASEPAGEAEPEAEIEPEVEAETPDSTTTETEAEAEFESAPEILAAETEPEHHRRFGLFRHEASEPASEAEPEAEIEPEVEAEGEVETGAEPESIAEIPAPEVKPERHGHFHLFGREEKAPDTEAETEPEAEAEPEAETELVSAPEILAAESEPEHHRRIHLFRHEASEPASEAEPEAEIEPIVESEVPNGEGAPLEDAFWQSPVEEPGSSAGAGDTTIEIDLPPEIPIGEIERTLEELSGREPGLRRRRWLRGASAEKDATEQSTGDETPGGASELRLVAELERRRREREYLRNLRASR